MIYGKSEVMFDVGAGDPQGIILEKLKYIQAKTDEILSDAENLKKL